LILTRTKRKEFDTDSEIDLKIRDSQLNSLLMIVPTNRRIRALKREWISASPNKVTGKINLETIGSVSSKLLFNSDSIKTNIISEAASSVLLQQSFDDMKLKYFSNYGGEIPSGTLERISNVISEYKRHGITPDKIKNEVKLLTGSEKDKALDIAGVFEKYQQKILSLKLNETGDIYSALINLNEDTFTQNFSSLYAEVNLVIIMGFDEFTLPEVEIINRLAGLEGKELFLSFDYYIYNPLIFSHLDNCYKNLLAKGFSEITDKSNPEISKFQKQVRENLFVQKERPVIDSTKDKVGIISASTREKEIELIASEIKQLILNKKVQPENICVVFNLIQKYSAVIRDVFPLYGLPFNLTDRFALDNASAVVSLISFLEIAENDFYYKNIFRSLSGGLLKIKGINITNLLKASINLKIISGFDNWQKSLNEALNFMEEDDTESSGELENSYRKALNDLDTISEYLKPFLNKMTIPEFHEHLTNLIYKLDLPVRILSSNSEETEKNIKSINVFIETSGEILSLLEVEYGRTEKFPLKFFLHNIKMAVSSSRYNIKEKPGYGIQVTTMNEIRGLKFDYLFIGGLCDGDFPTRFSPEIFFSGSMAKAKGELNHITEERYLFYQSLCAWDKKLYLSYPLRDERKEFVKSDFLQEFSNKFETSVISGEQYANTIYTREQLFKFIGEAGIDDAAKMLKLKNERIDIEEIRKALLIDKERHENPFAESPFTGFISGDLNEESMDNLRQYGERQFSISQLETYALCPYRYFAERILKLDILEEPTEEIEALELGSLLHIILFSFYSELKKKNIILENCSDGEFHLAEELLFKTAEEKVNNVNFNSPLSFFEREKIFGIDGIRKNSILFKFLTAERENKDGYVPGFFETGFGNLRKEKNQDVLIEELRAGEVKVRGKIDRIDINQSEQTFKVIDYKTGKSRAASKESEAGLQLQLPLYLFAAKEIIKAEMNENYKPGGALIYSLKYSGIDFGRKELKFGRNVSQEVITENLEKLIQTCIEAINRYVNGIINGDFRLTQIENREEKACKYCGFRSICRIQEAG
jgi:ATP-dependent helicase/nuclease subunit B